MSALAGIVRWQPAAGPAAVSEQIQNMVRSLAHRGGDGTASMSNDDGTVSATLDGALYDHLDLRSLLLGYGERFTGASDTETLLRGYCRLGADRLFRTINGAFAIAVLDRSRRKLMLARDAMGVKPLYLRRGAGQIAFASEIRAFTHDGMGRPSVDPGFLASYLQIGWVPFPQTAFAGVTKLAPGTVLEIDLDTGVETTRTFKRLEAEGSCEDLDEEAQLDLLRERLNWVIRRQLVADVPLAILLSGDLESAALLSGACSHLDRPPRSFSLDFDQVAGNAGMGAVAQALGSPHVALSWDRSALDDLAPIQAALEEPMARADAVPLWHLCRMAAAQVKVALSARGPGAAQAGMTGFDGHQRPLELFGAAVRRQLIGVDTDVVTPRVREFQATMRASGLDALQCERMLAVSPLFTEPVLLTADKMSMTHGLELRVPLADPKLIELELALPSLPGAVASRRDVLWGRLVAERLPRIAKRFNSRPFDLSAEHWPGPAGEASLRSRLVSGALVHRLGFSAAALTALLEDQSRADRGRQLFALAALEVWARQH